MRLSLLGLNCSPRVYIRRDNVAKNLKLEVFMIL